MREVNLNASVTECGFLQQSVLKHAYAVAFLNHAVVDLINQYADYREFFISDEPAGDEAIRELMEARSRINELESEIQRKDAILLSLTERVAAQSELLGKRSEKSS